MNTQLVNYGIQNEQSDIRVHVCSTNNTIYVYSTESGRNAISNGNFRKAQAFTNGIVTAEGYLVPPSKIPGCKAIPIPPDLRISIEKYDSTSVKGQKAVEIVKGMLKMQIIPLPVFLTEITDAMLQISGTDISISAAASRIQVKCDLPVATTGNLYLQISECNPYKRI